MTNERAIELLHRLQDEQFDGIHGDERREALSMAVRALEQNLVQESDSLVKDLVKDCISRNTAIDIIQSYKKNTERLKEISVEDVVDMFEDLIDDIENEPSVQPVREKGTWEKDELFGESAYVCTNCETIWTTGQIKNMHFCPTCGADMRGSSV